MNTIEELQKIVNDENRTPKERRQAAELILKQGQAQADDPALSPYMIALDDPTWRGIADDDPEILPLLKSCDDPDVQEFWPHLARPKTLIEAKRIVAKRRADRATYAVIVDEMKTEPERLAAIQTVLDQLGEWHWLKQFSPEQLMERIIPAGTRKLYSTREGFEERPIPRPPQWLNNVWSL